MSTTNINIPKPVIDYNDLLNLPTLVTEHSELTLDDGTNPHGTTATDVGLGNVPNLDTTDAVNKAHDAVTLTGTPNYLTIVGQAITRGLIDLASHVTNRLGFSNLPTGTARSIVGRAGSGNGDVGNISAGNNTILGRNGSGDVAFNSATETKQMLSLENVDNTSDLNKPISTATQTALDAKIGGAVSIGQVAFGTASGVIGGDAGLVWDNTNKRLGVGATPATNVRLDVIAQGALSTDVAFRVRNSANTIDRLNITGNSLSITTVNRAEMSVSANTVNFGLENHLTNIIHSSPATTVFTQTASSINRSFMATNIGDGVNTEALNKGCTIFGTTIRAGTFGYVQNKMHFVCDQTKWGLGGVYSAGFQWFKGSQSGDGGFSTATLPSITTGNRQMWLTPENSLLFFNTTGITYLTNTDSFQQYSADIVAGNAAPHFRTENGSVIKLYRQDLPTNPTNSEIATFLSNLGLANLI